MKFELDAFTPVSKKDQKLIKNTINYNSSKFIQNVERYVLFTESEPQKIKNTVVLTRDDFPFTREYVQKKLNFHPRSGWVYQQLVKFYFAKDISKKDYKFFKNLKFLIIDCLWLRYHPSHLNLESSLKFINEFKPKKAILTNLHSDLDYNYLKKTLPKNIVPAYDGLTVTL